MAGDSVTIKNVSNGAIHTVTPEMWTFLEDDPIYELYEEPKPAKSTKKAPKSGKTTGKTASESAKAPRKSAKTK